MYKNAGLPAGIVAEIRCPTPRKLQLNPPTPPPLDPKRLSADTTNPNLLDLQRTELQMLQTVLQLYGAEEADDPVHLAHLWAAVWQQRCSASCCQKERSAKMKTPSCLKRPKSLQLLKRRTIQSRWWWSSSSKSRTRKLPERKGADSANELRRHKLGMVGP